MTASMSAPEERPNGRSWRSWFGRVYVIGVLAAAVVVLVVHGEHVADLLADARPVPLTAALLLGLLSLLQTAWMWSRGLAGLGSRRRLSVVLEATVAAIPARYVPGSIWYAAGRITALRSSGSAGAPLAVIAALEMMLSFLVAVALGLGALSVGGIADMELRVATVVLVSVMVTVVASPWILNPAVRWVARRRGISRVPPLRWAVELELCAHLLMFWTTSATAFVLYLSAFPAVDAAGVFRTAGAFLLGWAVGFLTVFAPQGAGVMETVVAGSMDGAPLAVLAAVVAGYRALIAVRDAIALVCLAAARGRLRRSFPREASREEMQGEHPAVR